MSDEINLSDRYVLLLDESLEENRVLRQQFQNRETESARKLTELAEKVDTLCRQRQSINIDEREASSVRKQRRVHVHVPKQCRNEFRAMYNLLLEEDENFQGFNLEEALGSSSNKGLVAAVTRSVNEDHGGDDKCPWSAAQLKAASTTYFKSLKDARKRRQKGPSVDHNTVCRRQGRKREKLNRRLWAVNQINWTNEVIEKAKKALLPEYTSSDESEISEDENGDVRKRFVIKTLPWESKKLRDVKDLLDIVHKKSLPVHVRNFQAQRRVAQEPSTRNQPESPVKWAVKEAPLVTSTPQRASSQNPTGRGGTRGRGRRVINGSPPAPNI